MVSRPIQAASSLSRRRGGGADTRPSRRYRRSVFLFAAASFGIAVLGLYGAAIRVYLRGDDDAAIVNDTTTVVVGGGTVPSANERKRGATSGGIGGGDGILATIGGSGGDNLDSDPIVTIGHAVSLIKCSKGPSVSGFLDAAAVLRHSIHRQSVHFHPPSGGPPPSRYSYKMYAIVHPTCKAHAAVLERLGYETLVRDHPVKKEDIKGQFLRDHVEGENCCGAAEFIKLYAYKITNHPIVVHWDMDVAVLRPMDDMYDVMLHGADTTRGAKARERLERQRPEVEWPERIDAFFTRDLTSAKPWEKVTGVQGGFLAARPDPAVFDAYIDFIKEGNYKKGRGDGTGWGGLGYGGFQGAMAYQGAVAYYYDQLSPSTSVELNVCRWNQVAADVIWRGPDKMKEHHLQCRQYPTGGNFANNTHCEDCRLTPLSEVNTAHYTACKKPWECKPSTPRTARDKSQQYRLDNLVNITTCMTLFREWFELRKDFEDALEIASGGEAKPSSRDGKYEEQHFMGYCRSNGNYVTMNPPPENFDIKKMYGV